MEFVKLPWLKDKALSLQCGTFSSSRADFCVRAHAPPEQCFAKHIFHIRPSQRTSSQNSLANHRPTFARREKNTFSLQCGAFLFEGLLGIAHEEF